LPSIGLSFLFLYGEQPYYPRELANIPNVITYEAATGNSALDIAAARAFEGNETLGYKVAICERDVAIYGSLILAGLLFQLTGKKLKSIPWYWWVILAIIRSGWTEVRNSLAWVAIGRPGSRFEKVPHSCGPSLVHCLGW